MTIPYMQGFETILDDSDFRAQGWQAPAASTMPVVTPPSITPMQGRSLRTLPPYNSDLAAGDGGNIYVPGAYNTGITVNQAWKAGGFSFGFTGKWNDPNNRYAFAQGQILGASAFNNGQFCFDGTLYWAIRATIVIGGTPVLTLANSPDLINWTVFANQPPGALTANHSLSSPSPGQLAIVHITSGTPSAGNISPVVYYLDRAGGNWTTLMPDAVPTTTTGATGNVAGYVGATGNPAFPHVMYYGYNSSNNGFSALLVGNLATGMTRVATLGGSAAGWTVGVNQIKVQDGVICVLAGRHGSAPTMWSAKANDPALNTTAAWSVALMNIATQGPVTDIAYHQASGLWVAGAVTSTTATSGIYTTPAAGGAGSAIAPLGGPASNSLTSFPAPPNVPMTVRSTDTGISNVYVVKNVVYAFSGSNGNNANATGAIMTSTDGVTYTPQKRIMPLGANFKSGYAGSWRSVYWTGSQYVMCTANPNPVNNVTLNANFIIVSPDLASDYECKYASEGVEIGGITTNGGSTGLVVATAAPTAGTFTQASAPGGALQFYSASPASNLRNVGLVTNGGGWYLQAAPQPATGLISAEWVARATATPNTFVVDLYINNALVGTGTPLLLGSSQADVTSLFLIQVDRFGRLTAFDDITFTLLDGKGLQGPLGPINLISRAFNQDVQDQWVPNGAATNVQAVTQKGLSSRNDRFVSSTNAGDEDKYASTTPIPAGYTAKAVMLEGYFARTSTTNPVVQLSIESGAANARVSSGQVNINSQNPTYVAVISDIDPATGKPWTNAAIAAARAVPTHIS
ncbi:hypothetical protein [Burkholderia phage BCSR5]|nr:hypothetical protein [Burkholderia phage BCSR5]